MLKENKLRPKGKSPLKEALEQLESLQAELELTKGKLDAALVMSVTLKNWINTFFTPCPLCGLLLRIIPWNRETYILVCDNYGCKRYRQPALTIRKEDLASVIPLPNTRRGGRSTDL